MRALPERYLLTLPLLLAVSTGYAVPDEIHMAWDPVDYPELAGYRLTVLDTSDGSSRTIDVAGTETAATVSALAGDCRTHCISVRTVATSGETSPESPAVCGIPDPEIFEVIWTDPGWRVIGDNFPEDVQVYLDGADTPVAAERDDCATLRLSQEPTESIRVHNPTDGVNELWNVPFPEYFEEWESNPIVLLECRAAGDANVSTVTAISRTPGLDLAVEADYPGVGTDCAEATSAIVELLNLHRKEVRTIPLGEGEGEGEGFLHIFVAK